ncbi:translocator protein isoform X1 [Elysia marginata]|uniref:Translocator protein isoform X1 n=1 Tax=Elysia marginata TaxID=1093978 RepID=A0AAV4FY99_9GAST|nr:translocator protein isoform X1 [Elysia marginata]
MIFASIQESSFRLKVKASRLQIIISQTDLREDSSPTFRSCTAAQLTYRFIKMSDYVRPAAAIGLPFVGGIAGSFISKSNIPNWYEAFVDIVALWGAVAGTIYTFHGINETAAYLLIPYLGWVTFASALNFWHWRNNPSIEDKKE